MVIEKVAENRKDNDRTLTLCACLGRGTDAILTKITIQEEGGNEGATEVCTYTDGPGSPLRAHTGGIPYTHRLTGSRKR